MQVSRAKSFAFLFKIPNILITKLVAFFSKLTKVKCKITLHAPQNHFFALTSKVKMVPIIFCKTPLLKKHWRRSQKSQLWSLTNVINYQDSHRISHRANFTCVTKETRTHFSDVFMSFFLTWPLFMRLWWCSSSTGGVNASFHSWIILFICQSALHLGWGCRKKCKWGNSKSIRLSRLFLLAYLVWWCRRKTVGRRGTYFNQDFEKMIG